MYRHQLARRRYAWNIAQNDALSSLRAEMATRDGREGRRGSERP